MAWEPDERAQINALRRQGIVALRYAVVGCNVELEVLPNCIGNGTYRFEPTPSYRHGYITTHQDLFAELPLGGASLSGFLRGNRILRTDWTLVGIASLPPGQDYAATELRGPDCARATHVVARVYLGGFAMAVGDDHQIKARAALFGATLGGGSESTIQRVMEDGDPGACAQSIEDAKEDSRCAVPLRIGLLALHSQDAAVEAEECEAGMHFETGSGCVSDVAVETNPVDASVGDVADPEFAKALRIAREWDRTGAETPHNATARNRTLRVMEQYYSRNRERDAAARYVVHAAYWVAAARSAEGASDTDEWWRHTIDAFERWKTLTATTDNPNAGLGTPEAALGAEADYTLLDARISQEFDYETGHQRYLGTPNEVLDAYRKGAADAQQWYDGLQHNIDAYASPDWAIAAITRQGSLYDTLRTALSRVKPPELALFDAKTEALLTRAEASDSDDLHAQAAAVRNRVQVGWHTARERELDLADQVMLDRYMNAHILALHYKTPDRFCARAKRRLAFFTELLGDAKLREMATRIPGLEYRDGMYLTPSDE